MGKIEDRKFQVIRIAFRNTHKSSGVFMYVLLVFALSLASCKKDEITVTTNNITEITDCSAICGGTVLYTGNFFISDCGVCYSESSSPTVNESHTTDNYGVGSFSSKLTGLRANTTYYVRAYAETSSGIIYGNQKSFTTKTPKWLLYGNNEWYQNYGLLYGGALTWAVMFPSSMLSSYNGTKITKVKIYAGVSGSYSIKIYKGGSTSPTTLLSSESHYLSSGNNTIEISPAITLTTTQNLWVSASIRHLQGEHPAGCSLGISNPNARWRYVGGEWKNEISNGWNDACWIIQVGISETTSNRSDEDDIILMYSNEQTIPSNYTPFNIDNCDQFDKSNIQASYSFNKHCQ